MVVAAVLGTIQKNSSCLENLGRGLLNLTMIDNYCYLEEKEKNGCPEIPETGCVETRTG